MTKYLGHEGITRLWRKSLGRFKTRQTAVSDPTASSTTSTTFIDSITQDANGKITATKKTIPDNWCKRNYFAKKFMMEWNDTYAGISTKGVDSYGAYIAIDEQYLRAQIGGGDNRNNIIPKVTFKAGTKYTLKVNWRNPSTSTYFALVLGFLYEGGSYSDASHRLQIANNQTTKTTQYIVSEEGKNVIGIYAGYGSWNYTRIYEISLTEGCVAPTDWIEAEEDIEYGGENLIGEPNPLEVVSESGTKYKFVSIIGGKTSTQQTGTNSSCVNSDYLENGREYVFSVDKIVQSGGGAQTKFYLQVLAMGIDNGGSGGSNDVTYLLPIKATKQQFVFSVPDDGKNYRVRITNGEYGSSLAFGKLTFYNMMLQKGNRATEYQKYYKYLAEKLPVVKGSDYVAHMLCNLPSYSQSLELNEMFIGQNGVVMVKKNQQDRSSSVLPIGTIVMWPTATAPTGWLICDGQPITGDAYADLRTVLGGATTVPNLSGRFPLGSGNSSTTGSTSHSLASSGGEEKHTLTTEEMPVHTHSILYGEAGSIKYQGVSFVAESSAYSSGNGSSSGKPIVNTAGSGYPHNNMPPFYTLNFIIKYA